MLKKTPWIALVVAGALAWAVHLPLPLVAVVAAVGFAGGLLIEAFNRPSNEETINTTPSTTKLYQRMQESTEEIEEMTLKSKNVNGQEVRHQVAEIRKDFVENMNSITRFERALGRIDVAQLKIDNQQIHRKLSAFGNSQAPKSLLSSQKAVSSQIEIYERLRLGREELLENLQSACIGLDAIVAQIAELDTLANETVLTSGQTNLEEITHDLETLRDAFIKTRQDTQGYLKEMP